MCKSLSARLHIVNAQACVVTIGYYSLGEIFKKGDVEEEGFIFY